MLALISHCHVYETVDLLTSSLICLPLDVVLCLFPLILLFIKCTPKTKTSPTPLAHVQGR